MKTQIRDFSLTARSTGTLAILTLSTCCTLAADNSTFKPVSVCEGCSTQPYGINSSGQISGSYIDAEGEPHGFVKVGAVYKSIDGPQGAVFVEAAHNNNLGQAAGDYVDGEDGIVRPMIWNPDGTLDLKPGYPHAAITYGIGLTDYGHLVGSYTADPDGNFGWIGYVLSGKEFTLTFSYPGASVTNTYVLDVNNAGTIVGSYTTKTEGEEHGFIRFPNGAFQQLDFPGSKQTEAFGISDAGAIVGRYQDAHGVEHGFILHLNKYTTVDFEGAGHDANTFAWDISDSGEVVGYSFPGERTEGPFSGFAGRKLIQKR